METARTSAKRIRLSASAGQRSQLRTQRIVIHGAEYIDFVLPADIRYLRAESNYCMFILMDGRTILASKPLAHYQSTLEGAGFIRPHQSFLVNPTQVRRVRKVPACALCMSDDSEIPVSRARKGSVVELLTTCP